MVPARRKLNRLVGEAGVNPRQRQNWGDRANGEKMKIAFLNLLSWLQVKLSKMHIDVPS